MKYKYQDVELNYKVVGEGKPVLLIHGLDVDMKLMISAFEPIFRSIQGYKRYYIDLPGMGFSTSSPTFTSSDKVLELLLSFIEDRVDDNFILIGQSYGGYLSRGILLKTKKKIKSILLLSPVIKAEHKDRDITVFKKVDIDDKVLENLSNKEIELVKNNLMITSQRNIDRVIDEIMSGLNRYDKDFVHQLKKNYTFSFDVDYELSKKRYKPYTVFILGREDYTVGYRDALSIVDDYKDMECFLLNHAGHNPQIDRERFFNEIFREFLIRSEEQMIKED